MDQDQKPTTETFMFVGFQSPNFTPVPDEVFDQLLPLLSGAEMRVLLYIIRRTFGFKKQSDDISFSQICTGITTKDGRVLDSGTGLSKSTAQVAIKGLINKQVIMAIRRKSAERGNEPTTYALHFRESAPQKPAPPYTENRHRGMTEIGIGLYRKSAIQDTVLQDTENHVNVGLKIDRPVDNSDLTNDEAQEEDLIDQIIEQLEDHNAKSRRTYRLVIKALGTSIVWRLLGNTKEAYRDGIIQQSRAQYFMGMAKKIAVEQGVELVFHKTLAYRQQAENRPLH